MRGKVSALGNMKGLLTWDVGGFRTNLSDDIFAIATSLSSGFFQNVGTTRREGAQARASWRWDGGQAYVSYSYVDATFRSPFVLSSPSNPAQDENGDIQVQSGDRLPGVPRQRVKAGVDYNVVPRLTVGGTLAYVGSQFYRGDESNQNAPLPGYTVVGVHASWRFWRNSELFLAVQNLTDKRYATYGIYSDPTGVGAPGVPPDAASNDPSVDNRFQSPGAPRAYFAGLRIEF